MVSRDNESNDLLIHRYDRVSRLDERPRAGGVGTRYYISKAGGRGRGETGKAMKHTTDCLDDNA